MYIRGIGEKPLKIDIPEEDYSILGRGKTFNDVLMNSFKTMTPKLNNLQTFFEGYKTGFIEPDVVLFEKGNLNPSKGFGISNLYENESLLDLAYKKGIEELNSSINTYKKEYIKNNDVSEDNYEWYVEIGSPSLTKKHKKEVSLLNRLQSLKTGDRLGLNDNRRLISWYVMSNNPKIATPLVLSDNFVLANRNNILEWAKHDEQSIIKNIKDLRTKNRFEHDHLAKYSEQYKLKDFLTLPEFLPGENKVLELVENTSSQHTTKTRNILKMTSTISSQPEKIDFFEKLELLGKDPLYSNSDATESEEEEPLQPPKRTHTTTTTNPKTTKTTTTTTTNPKTTTTNPKTTTTTTTNPKTTTTNPKTTTTTTTTPETTTMNLETESSVNQILQTIKDNPQKRSNAPKGRSITPKSTAPKGRSKTPKSSGSKTNKHPETIIPGSTPVKQESNTGQQIPRSTSTKQRSKTTKRKKKSTQAFTVNDPLTTPK